MSTPLLTTKICVPPPRRNLVPRPRLFERLDQGLRLGHRLILVSASAGFGKTTLLSEWVHRKGTDSAAPALQVAWLTLDVNDNDPSRIMAYLFATLARAAPDLDISAPEMESALTSPLQEAMLVRLVNCLTRLETPLVLVLDDYQVIESAAIESALSFLIDYAPPSLHVIIASRVSPSLPLAKWRVRQQLTEVRSDDLRFTRDETRILLESALGLHLCDEDLDTLDARAEGWIAALQLVLVSMAGRPDISQFVQTFGSSHRYVLDYLIEEVLQQQPEDNQEFLLQTSILERLTGPLCEAVCAGDSKAATGSNGIKAVTPVDGQKRLTQLEQANLLLIPLDDRRQWYRYHHLFADFLRARLQAERPSLVLKLHRRAAEWYAREEMPTDAIHHALAAGAHDLAGELLHDACAGLLHRGEVDALKRWMQALPEVTVRASYRLSLGFAWARILTGDMEGVDAWLGDLERMLLSDQNLPDEMRSLALAELTALRARKALQLGRVEQGIAYAREALAQLPGGETGLRSVLAFVLGSAHRRQGEVEPAMKAYEQAIAAGKQSGVLIIAFRASYHLGRLGTLCGHLREAEAVHRQALTWAKSISPPTPAAGLAHVGLGMVLWEQFNLDAAKHHIENGVELCQRSGAIEAIGEACNLLARIHLARGEALRAQAAMETSLLWSFDDTETRAWAELLEAQCHLVRGNLASIRQWLVHRADHHDASCELRNAEALTRIQIHLALGEPERAQALLTPLQKTAETKGLPDMVEVLALQALAYRAQRDTPRALAILARALEQAEPEGQVRVFAQGGLPMRNLLLMMRHQASGISEKYIRRLLDALGGASSSSSAHPYFEPLTEREVEVLRLLPTEMTGAEIASQLGISPHTARTHIKNIYGKLDVHRRDEATERAVALGLL